MSEQEIKGETPTEKASEAMDPTATAGEAEKQSAAGEAKDSTTEVKTESEQLTSKKEPAILKTSAREDPKDRAKNNKFDPNSLPDTDNPDEIRGQVEYYFGNFNLPRDQFLWEQTDGPENKPVSLKTICTFKRMRRFQPYSAIVSALRASPFLDVSGEEGLEMVKRKNAYHPDHNRRQKAEAATLYVKGFGDEVATTQFDIEAFFTKFGPINGVNLRRTDQKLFKGSVFVEFQDEELAKKFAESKPQWKGHDLKVMTKKEYCEEKHALIRDGKMQPRPVQPYKFFEGQKTGRRGRDHDTASGNVDRDDWKKRREQDRKNGFRDQNRRDQRGRGRGGRGRGGGRRDHNSNGERPHIQATNAKGEPVDNADGKKPSIKEEKGVSEAAPVAENGASLVEATATASEDPVDKTNNKRSREDADGGDPGDEPPAKKIDAKPEITVS